MPKKIYDLASGDVKVLGYIKDLNSLLNEARLLVAPLRYGAGIKGKVALAMMAGLPIVASHFAVEGTKIKHFQECLIADTPADFVKSTIELYENEKLWTQIRVSAHFFANRHWGFDSGFNNLKKIVEELGFNVNSRKSY
jgi:glycosyltransferase involved in cell wall biosynthesis